MRHQLPFEWILDEAMRSLANGVPRSILFRLNVHFIQAKCVLPYRSIDPAVSRPTRHSAHSDVAAAITHRDQEIDHHSLEEDRLGVSHAPQDFPLQILA